MKTKLASFIILLCSCLSFAAMAQNSTEPQDMPISISKPKPPGQRGLRRPVGDGNVWTFRIVPEPDLVWVEGPNWDYPGKGEGADPDWGQWGGGDGELWLSWVSPQKASAFIIKVTGKVGKPGSGGGEPVDIEASWGGDVTTFSIAVRRKNSGDDFSLSATVAAGAKSNAGHQADVEIIAKDSAGNPIVGVSVPTVLISSSGQDAAGTLNASISMANTTTDASGKAMGTFTSGNRVETTTLALDIDGDAEAGEDDPTADVAQDWNELAGSEYAWEYEPEYEIGVASPLIYSMTFGGGVPIAEHSVNFYTKSIVGWEWNPSIPIDEDGDGTTDYYGNYDEDIPYYDSDAELKPGGIYAGLVQYTPNPTTGTSQGKYSTDMKVNDYIGPEGYVDFYTDWVEFGIKDTSILSRASN